MSRSFHSGRRPDLRSEKQPVRFQTFLKLRADHSIIKNSNRNSKKSMVGCLPAQPSEQENQTACEPESKLLEKTPKNSKEQCLGQSKTFNSTIREELNSPKEIQPFLNSQSSFNPKIVEEEEVETLDSLEKKVQELLESKLAAKRQSKRSLSNFRVYQDELEKDLQTIIVQLQQFSDQSLSEDINYEIREIAQKIGIIERIIAESVSESELLKKYYLMKRMNQKSPYSFETSNRRSLGDEMTPALYLKQTSSIPQHPSLHFNTISKSSYAKPNRDAYRRSETSLKKVFVNRQNIGRSEYQNELLNYGALPVYPKMKHQFSSVLKMDQRFNSQYNYEFTEKKAEVVDSKSLDCRKDKITPIKISYMPKSLLNDKLDKENKHDKAEIRRKTTKGKHRIFDSGQISSTSYASFYKGTSGMFSSGMFAASSTQYTSMFVGEKASIECPIKDKNLTDLKYQYKNQAKA